MSFKAKITGIGLSLSSFYANNRLNKKHGPQSKALEIGQKVIVQGQPKVVVGYFGAAKRTISNIDLNRPLYVGSKAVAQQYAKNRSKKENEPAQVVAVVADSIPSHEHLEMGRFDEGPHLPLSPKGSKALNVQVLQPEEVNLHTEIGTIANLKRMLAAKKLLSSN